MTDGRRVARTRTTVTGPEHAARISVVALVGLLLLLVGAPAHAQTADLSVTVTDAPDPADVFGPGITYTVTVTNNGPDAAADVVLLQALPPNNTGAGAVPPIGWTCTDLNPGGTTPGFECTIASLPVGSTVFTFTATISGSIADGAVLTDNVTVTSTTVDPDPTNNLASTTTNITNGECLLGCGGTPADVTVTKTGPAGPVEPGQDVAYTITFTNNGPSASGADTRLVEFTPPDTTFVSLVAPGGWTCTPPTLPVAGPVGTINCANAAGVASAGSAVFTLTVKVIAGTPSGVTITNLTKTLTKASSDFVDPAAGNNQTTFGVPTLVKAPTIAKAFGAATIALNTTTTLTFTITNPNSFATLTGVAFTDTLPAGLVVATPNGLTGSCGGTVTATAGSSSVSLSGGSLAAGASCNFAVNVTATTAGAKTNTTGAVTSANGGTGNTATANITVVAPPTISKAFGASTVFVGGTTSLTFTLTNPNAGTALTGIAFTDALPAGLVVATPNGLTGSCGGTVTATAGSSSISLSGGSLAAGASCNFAVNVTATSSGTKNNTTSAVTSTEGGTGNTASASLVVSAVTAPTISKAFGAATVPLNGTTTLTFTLTNPNAGTALTGVGFTDPLPVGLIVATPNGLTGSCGGTITATPDATTVSLAGATLAANGVCSFTVNVKATSAGTKNNVTSALSSNEGGPSTPATAVLSVAAPAPGIPTLSSWMFALLALLLLTVALRVLRARRA